MLDTHKIGTENINYTIEKKYSKSDKKFTEQEVTFDDTPLFFPEGFEKIFLFIYFISLPYITGLLFLFFYVAEGKEELFLSLNEQSSFILTWAIGYEFLAGLAILLIIKSAITFSVQTSRSGRKKEFRRP
jgi:hypothetical protein